MPTDPDYRPFHPNPKTPDLKVPKGAVDAHCHVFGPAAQFPFAPERKYTPVDAPKEKLFALRDHLGFARNVIVQASCHGSDNAALVDALNASGGRARGVAIVKEGVTDAELNDLHVAGVRGIRFNFVKRLVDATPHGVFERIGARVYRLGWHIVVYFEATDLPDIEPLLNCLPGPIVIDHMGRPDVAAGVSAAGFQAIKRILRCRSDAWIKVSCPERLTAKGPPYNDVIPFARDLVKSFPDRVLWGTDWPHPNMKSHMPDDGQLVDILSQVAPTDQELHRLLVTNPMRLYWDGCERPNASSLR